MTRPALVIGLGGTGQWVLTYLKKDLLESNNGVMPDNVILLCFDTLPQAGASLDTAGSGQKTKNKEVKVGSVQLQTGKEFVHLGGDVYDLTRVISEDARKALDEQKLPHLDSWFRADHWLETLPQASFRLATGAGQLRQFGRIALFKDLSNANNSEVWRRLDNSIAALSSLIVGEDVLEIFVVGSFAGGTGSGLFIDMGLLARLRARNTRTHIRGFFVLPHAFDPDADDDMLARSFAAWRELNRFMVVSEGFAMPRLVYNSGNNALQAREVRHKVFGSCYLVDGVRNGARIAAESELGVHPSIADTIGAILDDQAGRKYTEYAANLARIYASKPGAALYSVIGTHKYKVPVYYARQDFTHRFTVAWLKLLLKPRFDEASGRVIGVDPTSPFDASHIGRDDAMSLLTAQQTYLEESEAPTLFFNRISDILAQGGAANPVLVEAYALGSWKGNSWLMPFTELGNRADMVETINKIKLEAGQNVNKVVKTSKEVKDKDTRAFPKRCEANIPPWFKQHFGFRTAGGDENTGLMGAVLNDCGQAQQAIWRRQLTLWLRRVLMEGDRVGRVGYAYDLLDGLNARFDDFQDFIKAVQEKRHERQPFLKAQEDREKRRKAMMDLAGKKWPPIIPIVDDPQVEQSQIAYLKAEQAVVDARKDEILQGAVRTAALRMQAQVVSMRDELNRWIRLLAAGDPAAGVEGLYAQMDAQRREIERTRRADEALGAVQTRLGDLEYATEQEKEDLKRLMEGVNWVVRDGPEGFSVDFEVHPTDMETITLQRGTGKETSDVRDHLTQRNLTNLESYAVRRFQALPEQTHVVEQLRSQFTVTGLMADIGPKADALYDPQPGVQGGAARWSSLIRVNTDQASALGQQFILGRRDANGVLQPGLVQEMRLNKGLASDARDQDQLIDVVGSADVHQCTIVHTEDLIPVELFRAWNDCLAAYLRNTDMPPELNHNFPAEANAAKYELKMSRKWKRSYRVFHPWVVMLLEHPKRLEQFFLCRALGWLVVRDDGAKTWYELNVPGFEAPFKLTPESETLWSAFQAARFFALEGKDQTPYSNWQLDYAALDKALADEERRLGSSWLDFLKAQAARPVAGEAPSDAVVHGWLRGCAEQLEADRKKGVAPAPGEPADFRNAYADLADLALVMMEERKEARERRDSQSGRAVLPQAPLP